MIPSFWRTSVGKKSVMAVTGLGLLIFVIFHVLGNLQIFLGRDEINAYSQRLIENTGLMIVARTGLIAFALAHIGLGVLLKLQNRGARPIRYRYLTPVESGVDSRTMMWSGLAVLAFVLVHLAHFTFQWIGLPQRPLLEQVHPGEFRRDIYAMVTYGFSIAWIVAFYVLALVVLGFHVTHGLGSFMQTLGLTWPRIRRGVLVLSPIVAAVLVLAYIAIPAAVVLGLLPPIGH